jgi:hypothetical protein
MDVEVIGCISRNAFDASDFGKIRLEFSNQILKSAQVF